MKYSFNQVLAAIGDAFPVKIIPLLSLFIFCVIGKVQAEVSLGPLSKIIRGPAATDCIPVSSGAGKNAQCFFLQPSDVTGEQSLRHAGLTKIQQFHEDILKRYISTIEKLKFQFYSQLKISQPQDYKLWKKYELQIDSEILLLEKNLEAQREKFIQRKNSLVLQKRTGQGPQ